VELPRGGARAGLAPHDALVEARAPGGGVPHVEHEAVVGDARARRLSLAAHDVDQRQGPELAGVCVAVDDHGEVTDLPDHQAPRVADRRPGGGHPAAEKAARRPGRPRAAGAPTSSWLRRLAI